MIRVFIADDHAIVRSGLQQLMAEESDIKVSGESTTTEGIEERLRKTPCDVLVLDINLPGGTTPELVRRIATLPSKPAVIVYTMYPEDSHAIAYLRAGAMAFINKKRSIDELIEAIRRVSKGKRYITPDLAQYLINQDINIDQAPGDIFTAREREVILGLAAGDRPVQIAAKLDISPSTVNTFIQRIKEKLGVRSAVEIVDFARDNGLLG